MDKKKLKKLLDFFSSAIIHLTGPTYEYREGETIQINPFNNLISILTRGKIIGSDTSGFISGLEPGERVSCFSKSKEFDELFDFVVRRNRRKYQRQLYSKDADKVDLNECYGVMIQKEYVFKEGLKKVTYASSGKRAAELKKDRWKFVLNGWEWEREYRLKGNLSLYEEKFHIMVKTILERKYLRYCYELANKNKFKELPNEILSLEEMAYCYEGDHDLKDNFDNTSSFVTEEMCDDLMEKLVSEGKDAELYRIEQTPLSNSALSVLELKIRDKESLRVGPHTITKDFVKEQQKHYDHLVYLRQDRIKTEHDELRMLNWF